MPILTRVRQLVPAVLTVGFALALGACATEYPNSTFNHHTDLSTDADKLWDILLLWGTIVFIIVEGVLVYTIFKFRKRPDSPPPQMTHGNTTLEIAWTVLPIVILVIIAIPTVRTIFKTQANAPAGSLEIEVIGHQWWWEYKYTQKEYNFATANEFYIPKGRTVNFTLKSIDVLHSFWVPQLGGKRDLITTRTNHLWYTPSDTIATMVWNGFCTEYCGDSHANMRIRAYTVPPEEFEQWAAGQKAQPAFTAPPPPAAPPASKSGAPASKAAAPAAATPVANVVAAPPQTPGWTFPVDKLPAHAIPKTPVPSGITFDDALLAQGDAERGRVLFSTTALCASCHSLMPNMASFLGPNLTHIASRHTIAAGLYPNDGPHLARWIKNARRMKPGVGMFTLGAGQYDPILKKETPSGKLTDAQIADIVAYLQALK